MRIRLPWRDQNHPFAVPSVLRKSSTLAAPARTQTAATAQPFNATERIATATELSRETLIQWVRPARLSAQASSAGPNTISMMRIATCHNEP